MKTREICIVLLLLLALLAAVAAGIAIDRALTVPEEVIEPEIVDLLISEICAKNTEIIRDSNGKHSDYIELYNQGEDCNLKGFTVSDGQNTSAPFGDTPFKAGTYLVIFIDRDLTGFSLSAAGGETLFLYNRDEIGRAHV